MPWYVAVNVVADDTGRVREARPATRGAEPAGEPFAKNTTSPPGAPPVTVAVTVVLCPARTSAGLAATVVVVATASGAAVKNRSIG